MRPLIAADDYPTFYAAMQERVADYHRDHRGLETFYILGRFELSHSCNVIWKLNRHLFTDELVKSLPTVMTGEQFGGLMERLRQEMPETFGKALGISEGVGSNDTNFPFPPPHMTCARCGEGWNLSNCHDCDTEMQFLRLKLDGYVGKTLKHVQEDLDRRPDAQHALTFSVHNKKWEDSDFDPKDKESLLAPLAGGLAQ